MMYLLIWKLYLITLEVSFRDSSWEESIANGRPCTSDLWCQNFNAVVLWSPSNHNQKYFRQRLKIHAMDSSDEKNTSFYINGYIYKVLTEVFTPWCLPSPNQPKKYSDRFYFLPLRLGPWRVLGLTLGPFYKIPEWSVFWPSFLNEWRP